MTTNSNGITCNFILEDNEHDPQRVFCDGTRCEIGGRTVKTWHYVPSGNDGYLEIRYTDGCWTHYKVNDAAYMPECPDVERDLTTLEAMFILCEITTQKEVTIYGK